MIELTDTTHYDAFLKRRKRRRRNKKISKLRRRRSQSSIVKGSLKRKTNTQLPSRKSNAAILFERRKNTSSRTGSSSGTNQKIMRTVKNREAKKVASPPQKHYSRRAFTYGAPPQTPIVQHSLPKPRAVVPVELQLPTPTKPTKRITGKSTSTPLKTKDTTKNTSLLKQEKEKTETNKVESPPEENTAIDWGMVSLVGIPSVLLVAGLLIWKI